MRTARMIFQQPVRLFLLFCFFVVVLSALLPSIICVTFFVIGQMLIARPIVAIVLGKAAIFHRGLNGRRADNTKQTLLDFSFSFFFFFLKGWGP